MATQNRWLPFASYGLQSEFAPSVGQEVFHCDFGSPRPKSMKLPYCLVRDLEVIEDRSLKD
jgi:hypothetical protein